VKVVKLLLVAVSLSFAFSTSARAQNWSGILDPTRAIDWSQAGIPGGIPNRTTICATINASTYGNGTSDASTAVQAALNSCAPGATQESQARVLQLSAGTFRINNQLTIPSYVTLRGAGAQRTILDAHNSGDATILVGSGSGTAPSTSGSVSITGGATDGSTSITVSSASGLSVGRYLLITELNDPNYVTVTTSNGTCTWCDFSMWGAQRVRGQIVEVTSVNGDTVGISPALYSAYPNTPLATPFAAAVKWAGVEDLQVYANQTLTAGLTASEGMGQAAYCWIKGVENNWADGNHVDILFSYRVEVRDSYFTEGFNHQSGNTDDDIYLVGKTSGALIENNILERTHSAWLVNWGSAGNVLAYNYVTGGFDSRSGQSTTMQIEMDGNHGAHPQFNLFEGNVGGIIQPDSFWGSSSYLTVFRNWTRGTTLIAPYADGTYTTSGGVHKVINWAAGSMANQNVKGIDIPYTASNTNLVGNVSGSVDLGSMAKYNSGSSPCTACIRAPASRNWGGTFYAFSFGFNTPADSSGSVSPMPIGSAWSTSFLHGNYDTASNAINWDINGTGSHTLPASFYRSAKPAWWGSSIPWPAIGPDVTSGTGPGGHTSLTASNPAQACYNSTTRDAYGVLQFDAQNCYGGSSSGSGAPPPAGLTATVH
jgi:hypothetical protein